MEQAPLPRVGLRHDRRRGVAVRARVRADLPRATGSCSPAVGGRARARHVPLGRYPATWRSGYAAACKAVYTGSIPVVASERTACISSRRSRSYRCQCSDRPRLTPAAAPGSVRAVRGTCPRGAMGHDGHSCLGGAIRRRRSGDRRGRTENEMSNGGHTRGRRLRAAIICAAVASLIAAASAHASVVYNNFPSPLPGNVVSEAFQATQTGQFGGQIEVAGAPGAKTKVTVGLSSMGLPGRQLVRKNVQNGQRCEVRMADHPAHVHRRRGQLRRHAVRAGDTHVQDSLSAFGQLEVHRWNAPAPGTTWANASTASSPASNSA